MQHFALIFLLPLIFSGHLAMSQRAITAQGGTLIGAAGSVSFSIGELAFETFTESGGELSTGVQQAYQLVLIHESALGREVQLTVYPNPAADFLYVQLAEQPDKITYRLFDSRGRKVSEGPLSSSLDAIPVYFLANAVFILELYREDEKIKTIKILKR